MDDLTRYIVCHFSHLMTPDERTAYKTVLAEEKATATTSPGMQKAIRQLWVSEAPEAKRLLQDGPEAFLLKVRERILNDHGERLELNLCPVCGSLARTPKAKQCPKCFHSWHAAGVNL